MKPVTDPAILAQLNGGQKPVTDPAILAQLNGPQPGIMDRIAASPPVRFLHDAIAAPVQGMVQALAQPEGAAPFALPYDGPRADVAGAMDAPYQGALGRNRNTPGYAGERALADKAMEARGGSGFQDQMFAPFLPSVAGMAGLPGGLDSSNAMADAQTAGQEGYAGRHPILSLGAGLLGGALSGVPEGVAKGLPVYAGDNPTLTRLVNPGASGPHPMNPWAAPVSPGLSYVRGLVAKGGKTAGDLAAFNTSGKPFTAAEAIGKPAEVAVGALARREGSTADALAARLGERTEAAPDRILGDFAETSGILPEAARGDIKSLVAAGRVKAAPLYDEAYAQAPVITDRLNAFKADPIIQRGMKEGIRTEQLKALAEGKPFDPNAYAITSFDAAGDPVIGPVPTWRSWDAAKLGLDDILETYRDKTTGRLMLDKRGNAINDVRKAMLREIDGVNHSYKAARSEAGDYLSAQNSFENGGKMLLNGNMPAKDFADHVAGLDPADKQAFIGGSANNLFNLAQNGKLTPKVFNRPVVKQKLSVMLGPDKAEQFIRSLEAENRMAGFARLRAPGAGSPTAEYQAAMQDQDGAGLLPQALGWAGQVVEKGPIKGSISYGVGRGKDALAAYATRGMPIGARDEAGRLLMLPPQQLGGELVKLPSLPVKGPIQFPPQLLPRLRRSAP